mgnify:CR=1 FL=1|tara:strand:- start:1151 stop:1708 length:558 start_codon:yes stop_codon:yes gene_type:complete
MNILAIIPARGGSKRLNKKNIYPIWGQPMIHWAIKSCKDSQFNIKVCVSTDNTEIKKISKSYDAVVHNRSKELSNDSSYKQAAIRSAAKWYENKFEPQDIYISLQANSPQIKSHHIDLGINTLIKYNRDEIFSVDKNLMQNAAFRIFRKNYVFQEDLSTNCGAVICEVKDVHDINDIKELEKNER